MRHRFAISREAYEARAGANVAKTAWHKPELRPLLLDGVETLVKDYRRCPLWWRATYGRFMVAREATIYDHLHGLPGIPRYFGRIDALAFAVERVEGRDLAGYRRGQLTPAFLDLLEETVQGMHDRGVVHWDLRQRRNVIRGPRGRPFLIDFASAVRLPPGSAILHYLAIPDRSGVAKLRKRHAPETLSRRDRELLGLERWRPLRTLLKRRKKRRKAP